MPLSEFSDGIVAVLAEFGDAKCEGYLTGARATPVGAAERARRILSDTIAISAAEGGRVLSCQGHGSDT